MSVSKKQCAEIGSEFWDVPQGADNVNTNNRIFTKSTQWFLSGRSALQAIIKEFKGCRTVAIPSWCCDSMVKPFVDAGLEVHFYPVYWENGLVQEIRYDSDVLFLMDYFGYTSYTELQVDLLDYKGLIIRDVTHSLFSGFYSDADYYFGSLRKWCGVWTGGYAWLQDGHKLIYDHQENDFGYISLREKAMQLKSNYINGVIADKSYLSVFNEAEEVLESVGVVGATARDVQVALQLDVEYIRTQRRKNAVVLREAFPEWLMFREMKDTDCPMFVPIIVPGGKRDELRRYLINNEIYCPVHWPISEYHTSEHHMIDNRTKYIYANELSLICDQRYTEEDMRRMVGIIKAFWKEA